MLPLVATWTLHPATLDHDEVKQKPKEEKINSTSSNAIDLHFLTTISYKFSEQEIDKKTRNTFIPIQQTDVI